MQIGIHITTYNRLDFTEKCLKSLFWSNADNYELVIVDNNISDNTKEFLRDLKHPSLKKVIFNNENRHLGYAVNQGWNEMKHSCDVLAWINNDFLFEPLWNKNVVSCFTELNLDYISGLTNLTHKQKIPTSEPKATPSGQGHYVLSENVGAAYFLLTKHFINGFAPSIEPWYKGYTGPGPSFHYSLKKLRGVRLLSPGLLLINPEYTSKKFKAYYNEVFSIRGLELLLSKFQTQELKTGAAQGITWFEFLKQYYPQVTNGGE